MKRLIEFCKGKYKILIPVMVILVLLVTIYFLYREYRYDNYRNRQEASVFQYFGGIKNEYTAIITYNLKDIIMDVSAKNKKIEYDSTPIYYESMKKIIFPSEMNIVFPIENGMQYKLYKYSIYENDGGMHSITTNNLVNYYDYFFLFDGKGLYFFPDAVTININGKKYKELSPMSYVEVVGGYTMTYYDYEKDESEFLEIEGKKITVNSGNVEINLNERYLLSFEKKVLLFDPSNLNTVK